jgi:BirA family transcriptional regulator, biotin operon repressor / biotin---[acetyl-CoA-carboxylase] ligase
LEKTDARASILRRFEERSSMARGRRVHVDENGGYDGVTDGLDSRGFMQVRTDAGLRVVMSATITAR